ncbi:D-glycero-beta-D-manno-heptose 1,7-bisphosphate 7-phosphatase [Sulfurimonas sp.]|uniref:D-glycero-beta-D-manno-heptose 1,7-bisphosphate 7-phosphatase n=1 Tax=Sulfurimonas sp. TaxID=2022749 RepID=UPI0035629B6E
MNKALFLDRDGVINVEKDYLYKIEDFEFIDGIFNICQYFINNGYLIIIVTNQSGIGRGYYTEEEYEDLTSWMLGALYEHGIEVTHVYHCPHHPDITGSCECRKPKPGMLLQAAKDFDIDLENSVMIGDKERDIEAALNAGLKTTYLFDESKSVKKSKATMIIDSLKELVC